jgi:orotate phosphoribosyltransferase-like protein
MDTPNSSHHPTMVEALTERELDGLRLKARNRSNREIADELVLALNTVKWYVRRLATDIRPTANVSHILHWQYGRNARPSTGQRLSIRG